MLPLSKQKPGYPKHRAKRHEIFLAIDCDTFDQEQDGNRRRKGILIYQEDKGGGSSPQKKVLRLLPRGHLANSGAIYVNCCLGIDPENVNEKERMKSFFGVKLTIRWC